MVSGMNGELTLAASPELVFICKKIFSGTNKVAILEFSYCFLIGYINSTRFQLFWLIITLTYNVSYKLLVQKRIVR